jgi:tetraacyldisaccharide 4'-kinase
MLSPADFREIISGRRTGIGAMCWRGILRAASVPYSLVMRVRNWRYDSNPKLVTRVSVPVISIGNITLGGTGKTPFVEWISRWFRNHNVRVSIISRGYNAAENSRNDEAIELEEKLPDVPHIQNPNRIEAAQVAIEELETQLIVLDDAMQHRRIGRDLEIVLIDALEPFGFGAVFPRGTLREPIAGVKRADVLVLTKANLIDMSERAKIRERYEKLAPSAAWVEAAHQPVALRGATGEEKPLNGLAGASIGAFCGIGNPTGFRGTISSAEMKLIELKEFPDHHLYSRDDVEELNRWASSLDVAAILCTHKDLVKIGLETLGGKPFWAVRIGMQILAGEAELESRLKFILSRIPQEGFL